MEHRSIYEQIAGRTDGTVYIGVVGPVRTGKSTFIKRFMEQLVLPNIENVYERERATDELPQSGSGRTIMTAEPKFVPNEAARISPDGKTTLRVRLIDSVGYMIPGAVGDTEDGKPRMVTTPWAPEELPMAQAAELGTKKVMEDHSSLGVVVTTDGTVTDIPREDYREAEARAITDMQKTGKPFVVLVNTQSPGAAPAEALCAQLRSEYGVQALAMDCMHMQTQDIGRLLEAVMYAFPVEELRFFLPSWVRALPDGHPVKAALYDAMLERAGALTSLSEAESVLGTLQELEPVDEFRVREVDLGTGTVSCELHLPQALFYEELSRQAGVEIADDEALLQMLQELAQEFDLTKIDAVGVSQKPRPVEGSYMPCFLAGVSAATAFAAARDIPLIHTTHQQGHAAAALYAAKGEALFSQKVLLFHISGGTTDLLLCDQVRAITTLGTSTDLYAGQAVDRVGVRLGFGFPAGAEVSRLAAQCAEDIRPKSSVKGLQCSLSGLENQCNALLAAGKAPEYVCKYCLLCVADTVVRMTKAAQKEYPGLPVVCAGGVMSSDIIRIWVQQRLPQVYFVPGQYSSDNAIGVSILAAREAGLWLM